MTSAPFSKAFTIFNTDENGEPVEIMSYDTNAATYIAVSISICRGMLRHPTVKDTFKGFAKDIDPKQSGAWYQNLPKENAAELFIEKVLERFPLVFVDKSRVNPNLMASHWRRGWGDDGHGFDTHDQAIVINGLRVRTMCLAGAMGEKADPTSDAQKRFRSLLFQLAVSFLHELSHMFLTFLGRGKVGTPPHMSVAVDGSSEAPGPEAGRYLETSLFGGFLNVFRDTAEDDDQAGLCYLFKKAGPYPILQETIDAFTRYQFQFPITGLGPLPSTSLHTLGYGRPINGYSPDPLEAPQTKELLDKHKAKTLNWDRMDQLIAKNSGLTTFSKDQKTVMEKVVAFEPGRRIIEKAK